jgi:hypothetical protein
MLNVFLVTWPTIQEAQNLRPTTAWNVHDMKDGDLEQFLYWWRYMYKYMHLRALYAISCNYSVNNKYDI